MCAAEGPHRSICGRKAAQVHVRPFRAAQVHYKILLNTPMYQV